MSHGFDPEEPGDPYCRCGRPERHPEHAAPAAAAVAAAVAVVPPSTQDPIPTSVINASTTLAEVQDWLRENIHAGVHCPACNGMAKVYRRKMSGAAVREFILTHQTVGQEWFHASTTGDIARHGGEFYRLGLWGLMVEEPTLRPDGGRAGWWRISDEGVAFIRNRQRVPKYLLIYNGALLSTEGVEQSVVDVLGNDFNYRDLMANYYEDH